MVENICNDLTKYLQELKQDRKTVREEWGGIADYDTVLLSKDQARLSPLYLSQFLADVRKAQQTLESSFKHLETVSDLLYALTYF